ncbi:MAG: TolC family protein [Gemmatimonadetes bacterium]|nr:TolC family protein [Gemmatimonadota bacterium]
MIALLLIAALHAPQDSSRLTITGAVDRALATHPTVAVSRAAADVAAAEVGQARAAWLPGVSLDGGISRFQEPMIVWPLHGFDFRNPPFFDTKLSHATLGATYTVYDFGSRSAKVRAAVAQQGAADASQGATEQLLLARTMSAYLRVLTSRGVLAAEDQRLAALTAEATRARERFTAGKAARVDTLRAAAELAGAAADRIQTAASVNVAESDLARLMGVDAAIVHRAALAPVQLASLAARLPDATGTAAPRAAEANAEVRAAARRADAAAASVGAAKATRFPQLQATSAVVDRSNITGRWISEWQVGLGLSWPIFTGGARSHAIDRAEASSRAAREQLRLTVLAAEQQQSEAQAAYDAARARNAALATAVEQAEEVARITALARDVGGGTQTDYLLAEAALFRARSALLQSRHAVIAARLELARVTGELSRSWMDTSLETTP